MYAASLLLKFNEIFLLMVNWQIQLWYCEVEANNCSDSDSSEAAGLDLLECFGGNIIKKTSSFPTCLFVSIVIFENRQILLNDGQRLLCDFRCQQGCKSQLYRFYCKFTLCKTF